MKYYILAIFLCIHPVLATAHSGGIDSRGGHYCRTDCEAKGYFTDRYHFHPEKMDAEQKEDYERFKDRLCSRVVKRFSADEKMWDRVNSRVQKRFGFTCETEEQLHEASSAVRVSSVVDGDTIKIIGMNNEVQTVRIIGIDTPETVHPNKPVECFGKEASAYLTGLLEGQYVHVTGDAEDRYSRLLRYVYLDNQDVGLRMVTEGYAFSYAKYPHEKLDSYEDAEALASSSAKGLWGDVCGYQ